MLPGSVCRFKGWNPSSLTISITCWRVIRHFGSGGPFGIVFLEAILVVQVVVGAIAPAPKDVLLAGARGGRMLREMGWSVTPLAGLAGPAELALLTLVPSHLQALEPFRGRAQVLPARRIGQVEIEPALSLVDGFLSVVYLDVGEVVDVVDQGSLGAGSVEGSDSYLKRAVAAGPCMDGVRHAAGQPLSR